MEPRRVLFIAEGQLGDLLILTPALRAMKSSFPSAFISVLVLQRRRYDSASPGTRSIINPSPATGTSVVLTSNPHVDSVTDLDRAGLRALKGFARLQVEVEVVRYIRSGRYDTVICTFPEDRFAIWAFVSGARTRVGQKQQGMRFLLTHTPDIHKHETGVLKYYCALVESVGARVGSDKTAYAVPQYSRDRARDLFDREGLSRVQAVVAVHPGASGPYKAWPPDRCAGLIDDLQRDGSVRVILCGTGFDRPIIMSIKQHVRTRPVEIDTGGSVADFAAILERCSLCISNDSGPRHLAVAVGTKSLALFPRFVDREWAVYEDDDRAPIIQGMQPCPACPPGVCRNIMPENVEFGSHCMRMIEVGRVAMKAREMLATA